MEKLSYPHSQRLQYVFQGFRAGDSVEKIEGLTAIHPWFLEQIQSLVSMENLLKRPQQELDRELILKAKRMGFSDARIGGLRQEVHHQNSEDKIRNLRHQFQLRPAFEQVDTCAGEFEASTPYFYSTYWSSPTEQERMGEGARQAVGEGAGQGVEEGAEKESGQGVGQGAEKRKKGVVILGSGPNRIGQGIEFDYSCVRGVLSLQKAGCSVALINSNPETVSTDYDIADLLFFEPVVAECVEEVMHYLNTTKKEKSGMEVGGFVSQLGGQTALSLAPILVERGFKMLGTSLKNLHRAENRKLFLKVCEKLKLHQPDSAAVSSLDEAKAFRQKRGFPLICRPSYVLGGRAMEILENGHGSRKLFSKICLCY